MSEFGTHGKTWIAGKWTERQF